MTLDDLNQLTPTQAEAAFLHCCTASRWVAAMVAARPFATADAVHETATRVWADLEEADFLEAFEGHPKIGDLQSLKAKYAGTKQLASGEQASVQQADEATLQGLADGNRAYEAKFGFIFIVCATGKSAAEMLALLQSRLPHERGEELRIAAGEQARITQLRLDKLLASPAPGVSP